MSLQIHHFYMAMMALRRNPQRKCRKEEDRSQAEGVVVNSTAERPPVPIPKKL
jgi:translation elongation factor EF-Ts